MQNAKDKKVVVSSGFADFQFSTDLKVSDVFERADEKMYQRKKHLKENK